MLVIARLDIDLQVANPGKLVVNPGVKVSAV
jgi:hypothetical protein